MLLLPSRQKHRSPTSKSLATTKIITTGQLRNAGNFMFPEKPHEADKSRFHVSDYYSLKGEYHKLTKLTLSPEPSPTLRFGLLGTCLVTAAGASMILTAHPSWLPHSKPVQGALLAVPNRLQALVFLPKAQPLATFRHIMSTTESCLGVHRLCSYSKIDTRYKAATPVAYVEEQHPDYGDRLDLSVSTCKKKFLSFLEAAYKADDTRFHLSDYTALKSEYNKLASGSSLHWQGQARQGKQAT
ncbi:hypothetical protein F5X68DRAFT_25305 [Plectosphaerella plurivora]|uniref:Uncharacterized protein n=1 Tax=Plectosphaerella plurivora TaxID=936078 RepID=A0A9P8V7L3_9PEZI|nr:hypothetical protein F5X68DRAFT_25305 [Plectosphaerella plurivora]